MTRLQVIERIGRMLNGQMDGLSGSISSYFENINEQKMTQFHAFLTQALRINGGTGQCMEQPTDRFERREGAILYF